MNEVEVIEQGSLGSMNSGEGFRLSAQQAALIDEERRSGERRWLLGSVAIDLSPSADWEQHLRGALERSGRRHEILRTEYRSVAGLRHPLQVPRARIAYELRHAEHRGVDAAGSARRLAREAALERSCFGVAFVSDEGGQSYLGVAAPALSLDAYSLERWLMELAADIAGAHEGGRTEAEPDEHEPLQYVDYAEWQEELRQSEFGEQGGEFWRRAFQPAAFERRWPLESSAAADTSAEQSSATVELAESVIADAVAALAQRAGVGPVDAASFLWLAFAARCLDSEELACVIVSDERPPEFAATLGRFTRRLPLVVRLDARASVRHNLLATHARLGEARAFRECFHESEAASRLTPERVSAHSIGFELLPPDTGASRVTVVDSERPIALRLCRGGARAARLVYDPARFSEASVRVLAGQLETFVAGCAADPERPLGEVSLLGARERARVSHELARGPAHDGGAPELLHALVEQAARRAPGAPALVSRGATLSYGELDRRANQLAHALRTRGAGPDDVIAVCAERGHELVIALLGVLKSGAAYLPLDPAYPIERLRLMLAGSGCRCLVTTGAVVTELASELETLTLGAESPVWREPATQPAPRGGGQNLAYLIYTSGSTGTPKGVMVSHASAVSSTLARRAFYPEPLTSFLLLSSVSFDSSVAGIFWTLSAGGKLCLPEKQDVRDAVRIAELVHREQVSHLLALPGLYRQLLEEPLGAGLRVAIVAGEACPAELVARHFERAPSVALVNEYGPTEAAVWSSAWRCARGEHEPVPIGRPIAGARVLVLDRDLGPVPIGAAGEVYIGGTGLARGYARRPAATAERFVPDAFGALGERLYRTGDLGRWRADGALEYLGRGDQQVKIRGYRIELGEIEAQLRAQAEVADAVVVVRGDGASKRLVAYVVPADERARELGAALVKRLNEALARQLPEYMVPAQLALLNELPRSPNGKVDRERLPDPTALEARREYVAPRDQREQRLAEIWREVLKVDRVGALDNFFELGGDSILSLQVVARANRAGLELSARDVFEHQSLRELAAAAAARRPSIELPVPRAQTRLLVPGGEPRQTPARWLLLADEALLESARAEPGEPPTRLRPAQLERALRDVVQRYEALRVSFRQTSEGWTQSVASDRELEHRWREQPLLAPASSERDAPAAAAELARSLSAERGVLLRAVLLAQTDGREGLLIVAHRLALDHVSWSLVLDDLVTAYRTQPSDPPLAREPAPSLSDVMRALAAAEGSLRSTVTPPETAATPPAAEALGARWRVQLGTEQAARLERARIGYRASSAELLAAAFLRLLAGSEAETTRGDEIEVEHDGRAVISETDLSRAVGSIVALRRLSCAAARRAASWGELVRVVKETLRGLPETSERAEATSCSARLVRFACTEELGAGGQTSKSCVRASGELGDEPLVAELELRVELGRAGLALDWIYVESAHDAHAIREQARSYTALLDELARAADANQAEALSVSDFPASRLGREELLALPLDLERVEDIHPLSPMQQGMLMHTLIDPGSGIYLMQDQVVIDSELDVELFRQAWQSVSLRHEVLRTAFVTGAERPALAVVYRDVPPRIEYFDWRELDRAEQERALETILADELQRGYDMTRAPLWGLRLVRTDERAYRLVISNHHILLDAWSRSLLFEDVFELYRGLAAGRALERPGSARYRDFIAWLGARDQTAARAYWRARLAGFERATPLPLERDTIKPSGMSRVGSCERWLSAQETAWLRELASGHALTLNTLVQAAWALTLARFTGRRDVLFGVTVAGRPADVPRLERSVGLFISTIPLRVVLPRPAALVKEWLAELLAQNAAMRQHEHLPLVEIQQLAGIARGQPLFHSLLVFGNAPVEGVLRHAASLRASSRGSRTHTNYPLTVVVRPGERLGLQLSYDARFFNSDESERILTELERLLLALAQGLQSRLGELELVPRSDQRALERWNDTRREHATSGGYARLFAARVYQHPGRPAARDAGRELDYRQLNEQANRVGWALHARAAGQEACVALIAERGLELLSAIVGIFKVGACYVPLDPRLPAERVARMLERSRPRVVIVSRTQRAAFERALELCRPVTSRALPEVLVLEDLLADTPGTGREDIEVAVRPEQLAYIIYTSGSTGLPKGAMVEQAGMLNNQLSKVPYLGLSEGDVIGQTASLAFDISVWQLLAPLLVGACVQIVPDDVARDPRALAACVNATGISVLELVPALISGLLEPGVPRLSALRALLSTGEVLPPELARRWRERYPEIALYNAYGPAECSDDVAMHRVDASDDLSGARMPIGRPTDNSRLYVLDEHLQPTALGVAGELCIAGVGVGRGYVSEPGLTAAVFVPDPFAAESGARLYRSGDVARHRSDGVLEFLGRSDGQVKLRGVRLELGEIEARLRQHPLVTDALALVRQQDDGPRLVCYAETPGSVRPSGAELKDHLRAGLPDYMLPPRVITLARFPRSANGKLDRLALPDDLARSAPRTPPANELEQTLAGIWQELLGVAGIGRDDDFFELGGHSLLGLQLVFKLRAAFGVDLPLRGLFEAPVLSQLAERVEQQRGSADVGHQLGLIKDLLVELGEPAS